MKKQSLGIPTERLQRSERLCHLTGHLNFDESDFLGFQQHFHSISRDDAALPSFLTRSVFFPIPQLCSEKHQVSIPFVQFGAVQTNKVVESPKPAHPDCGPKLEQSYGTQ